MDIDKTSNIVPLNVELLTDRVKRILDEATPAKPARFLSIRMLIIIFALSFILGAVVAGTGAYILHLRHEISRLNATTTQH